MDGPFVPVVILRASFYRLAEYMYGRWWRCQFSSARVLVTETEVEGGYFSYS